MDENRNNDFEMNNGFGENYSDNEEKATGFRMSGNLTNMANENNFESANGYAEPNLEKQPYFENTNHENAETSYVQPERPYENPAYGQLNNGDAVYGTENTPKPHAHDDFNTSGESYNVASTYGYNRVDNTNPEFYNTNIKKKPKKTVPVYVVVASVLITAVLSAGGVLGYNYIMNEFGGKDVVTQQGGAGEDGLASNDKSDKTQDAAVVATTTEERDGKKPLTTPEIVDTVGPAVVGIINKAEVNRSGFFYDMFGGGGPGIEKSSGSGVVISADGYIVTNNHVIDGASEITVIMNTGDEYTATLIGADSKTDLAVLKIDAESLTFAVMGTSSDLRVGDTAIAIGNPLGQEFAGTTTQGIISGLNRSVTIDDKQLTLIQTDAAINPGNSGGALVDAYGHLIGINTAKISSSTLEGLGFAIPIDEAKVIINELIDNGYVTGRPILGIGGRSVTEEDAKAYDLKVGIYVVSMTPESPAYMAGIKIGDIIYECDGKKVTTVEELNEVKNRYKPGDELEIKVYRQGKSKSIRVVLGEEAPSLD